MAVKRRNVLAGLAAVAALAAVAPGAAQAQELLVGSPGDQRLVYFSSADPSTVRVDTVTGMQPGERILGLDRRPATNGLYALGSTNQVYFIDRTTNTAFRVGGGPFVPALRGARFGFDFNPTVDRIRINSVGDQNLRAHPDTGQLAAVDRNLRYGAMDVNAGANPNVIAAAYSNNDTDPATGTVLYDIDSRLDVLVTQAPPNDGQLNTVGPLGVDVRQLGGFDISSVDATAHAALVPEGTDRSRLYRVNLTSGAAVPSQGTIAGPAPLDSLAALGPVPPGFFG